MAKTPWRIEWRQKARDDLRAIIRYIGKDDPTRARSFGQALRGRVLPLAQYPMMGRTGRPGLPDDVRELVVHPNYIVLYRLHDETRMVEILQVKHTARHYPHRPALEGALPPQTPPAGE
jgi:plasmid stabilization system protein ParE